MIPSSASFNLYLASQQHLQASVIVTTELQGFNTCLPFALSNSQNWPTKSAIIFISGICTTTHRKSITKSCDYQPRWILLYFVCLYKLHYYNRSVCLYLILLKFRCSFYGEILTGFWNYMLYILFYILSMTSTV